MTRLDCPSCGLRELPEVAYCPECGFPIGQMRGEQADDLVGKTLAGGYRVVSHLADGSMGRVYRAEQSNLQRAVAVKVMNASFVADDVMVARFRNEARAASSLNHPNIVRVYDYGETPDGRPYLVMELLQGEELAELLAKERLQPVSRVIDLAMQILSALEEAHDLGIVHRDLKPENVCVLPQRGGGDLVKVVDFGLAKLMSGASPTNTPGLVFGTPEYISPEQAMAKETDGRADLYAMGVMLFEMLSGKLPFSAKTPREMLERHVYDAPPALGDLVPNRVMFSLDEVVAIALEKDPARRFQSAESFADALREIVAHRTGERVVSDRRSWVRQTFLACGMCGNRVLVTTKFCGECGEPMPRESIPSPISHRPQAASQHPPALTDRPPAAAAAMRRATIPELSDSRVRGLELEIEDAVASGDANSALVFLEQIAVSRQKAGDPLAAIVALRRGIEVAREDLDKGELENPIRVVALFSTKLGDAHAAAGEHEQARRVYKDALALSRSSEERAKLWVSLSRVAREQGHEADALEYLEAAEREAAGAARRRKSVDGKPPSQRGRRTSGVS